MIKISAILTWIERSQLRKQLLARDDRVLADIGISRDLLQRGVRAWPWTTPAEPVEGLGRFKLEPAVSEAEYATAVAELEGYADADLWDLGLTRGTIEEAVRHGRPGFPEDERRAA